MKKIISVILLCAMALTLCACGDKGAKAFEEASQMYDAGDYAGAFAILDENRDSGNADVQALLGDCYYYGQGTEQDYTKAAELYAAAAEQGSAGAQYALGSMYLDGSGMKQDYSKAVDLCTKAYEQGNMDACVTLGYMYENGYGVTRDMAKAVQLYTEAADAGLAWGQNNLGWCFYYGEGVDYDLNKAAELFEAAASQENINARYGFGLCSLDVGNYKTAFDCFKTAAEDGYPGAKDMLAQCYLFGYGTDADEAEAFKLLKEAVNETHDTESMYFLAQCYLFGADSEPDTDTAINWFTSAAEAGNIDAQVFLGDLYLGVRDGYVEMDAEEGIKWMTMAADSGDGYSMYVLELLYRDPFFGMVDMDKSLEYCKMAIENGIAAAADDLSLYDMEDGDYIDWTIKGAELGSMLCQINMAGAYCDGEYGLEKDFAKAAKYLKMAKDNTDSSYYDTMVQLVDQYPDHYPELKDLMA